MQKKSKKTSDSRSSVARLVANVLAVFAKATDAEKLHGARWYAEAFRVVVEIAEPFGISPIVACAVAAALSPNNSWSGNLADLQLVFAYWKSGKLARCAKAYGAKAGSYKPLGNKDAFKGLGIRTYPANVLKAYRILASEDISLLNSQKVGAFFHNIYFRDSYKVTIDTHAYSIAHGKIYTVRTCPKITPKVYAELTEVYNTAAESVGITGYQLQAITWCAYRRLRGLGAHLG